MCMTNFVYSLVSIVPSGYKAEYMNKCIEPTYRPYAVGVASRLATAIYVAMVTPILYDNSYSPNDSNLKYESYRPYG